MWYYILSTSNAHYIEDASHIDWKVTDGNKFIAKWNDLIDGFGHQYELISRALTQGESSWEYHLLIGITTTQPFSEQTIRFLHLNSHREDVYRLIACMANTSPTVALMLVRINHPLPLTEATALALWEIVKTQTHGDNEYEHLMDNLKEQNKKVLIALGNAGCIQAKDIVVLAEIKHLVRYVREKNQNAIFKLIELARKNNRYTRHIKLCLAECADEICGTAHDSYSFIDWIINGLDVDGIDIVRVRTLEDKRDRSIKTSPSSFLFYQYHSISKLYMYFSTQYPYHLLNIGLTNVELESINAIDTNAYYADTAFSLMTEQLTRFSHSHTDITVQKNLLDPVIYGLYRSSEFIHNKGRYSGETVLTRLLRGETVHINSGWNRPGKRICHFVNLVFKQINGEIFLAYCNRGQGTAAESSGITIYHVDKTNLLDNRNLLLDSNDYLNNYLSPSLNTSVEEQKPGDDTDSTDESDDDGELYLNSRIDQSADGVDTMLSDLKLTHMSTIIKTPQHISNCAIACNTMGTFAAMTFQTMENTVPNTTPITDEIIQDAMETVKGTYKAFRDFSRHDSMTKIQQFTELDKRNWSLPKDTAATVKRYLGEHLKVKLDERTPGSREEAILRLQAQSNRLFGTRTDEAKKEPAAALGGAGHDGSLSP